MTIDNVLTHPGYYNTPGNAYTVLTGDTYTSQVLSSHCRKVSLHANGHPIYFKLNSGTGEHYIKTDERVYITVPENSTLHVKTTQSNNGTCYISEYEW